MDIVDTGEHEDHSWRRGLGATAHDQIQRLLRKYMKKHSKVDTQEHSASASQILGDSSLEPPQSTDSQATTVMRLSQVYTAVRECILYVCQL